MFPLSFFPFILPQEPCAIIVRYYIMRKIAMQTGLVSCAALRLSAR